MKPAGSSFAGLGRLLSAANVSGVNSERWSPSAALKDLLADAERQAAEVYWYPGCGTDLTPLLLLPDNSVFQRQGFQPGKEAHSPLILWMTDLFPVDHLIQAGGRTGQPYKELWCRLNADCRICGKFRIDFGQGGPTGEHYILDADVMRQDTRTQRFRFLYSQASAEVFPDFFATRQIKIGWVAFIKATGGFGGPAALTLMRQLSDAYPPEAMPDAIIGDKNFSGQKWPSYTRLGSRSTEWLARSQLRSDNRMKTCGIKGWGAYHDRDWSNVAIWPRDDLYDHFMSCC